MVMNKKTRTQFDISKMLVVYKECPNYKISNYDEGKRQCIIYFSSNALYFPNEDNVFESEIIKKNRFEWSKNIPDSVRKVIFLRDVTKQWYLTGISDRTNSIDKLYRFLEEETRGLEVICVGGSAGGYAATLFGSLLKASCVFNFSGQFSLEHILEDPIARQKNPTLTKYQNDPNYHQYYSIVDLTRSANVPIFYFYPAKSKIDLYQCKLVESLDNVYKFSFDTSAHRVPCYVVNLVDLFNLDIDRVMQIYAEYKNTLIRPIDFSIKISGYKKTAKYLGLQFPSMLIKKIYSRTVAKISRK